MAGVRARFADGGVPLLRPDDAASVPNRPPGAMGQSVGAVGGFANTAGPPARFPESEAAGGADDLGRATRLAPAGSGPAGDGGDHEQDRQGTAALLRR